MHYREDVRDRGNLRLTALLESQCITWVHCGGPVCGNQRSAERCNVKINVAAPTAKGSVGLASAPRITSQTAEDRDPPKARRMPISRVRCVTDGTAGPLRGLSHSTEPMTPCGDVNWGSCDAYPETADFSVAKVSLEIEPKGTPGSPATDVRRRCKT